MLPDYKTKWKKSDKTKEPFSFQDYIILMTAWRFAGVCFSCKILWKKNLKKVFKKKG